MKFFLILIFLLFSIVANTGAPAPKTSLIQPPYTFKNGILIDITVKWNKESIIKYLPIKYKQKKIINGGINIYLTKSELPISRLNYMYAWIELEESNKKIFLGIFGPSEENEQLMENISEIDGHLGENRVMLINNKVSTRTSIKKSLVLSTKVITSEDCTKINKSSITYKKANTKAFFSVSRNSDEMCNAPLIELDFHGDYKDIIVEKILSGQVFQNTEIIFDNKT